MLRIKVQQAKNAKGRKVQAWGASLVHGINGESRTLLETPTGDYMSAEAAVQDLTETLTSLDDAFRLRILFCGDGTVLVVRKFGAFGGFGYSQHSPAHAHGCACMGGLDTLEQAEARARKHADQVYGGVVRAQV